MDLTKLYFISASRDKIATGLVTHDCIFPKNDADALPQNLTLIFFGVTAK